MKMSLLWILVSTVSLALFVVAPLQAESRGNTYINLSAGIEDFDSDRQLKSKDLIALGLEHRYSVNWAAELFLMDSDPRLKGSNEQIDLTQWGVDGIYYFDTDDAASIQPYAAIGLGISDFGTGSDSNEEAQARVGLGFRYILAEHWSVRADARLLYSEESHTVDNTLMIGLSYAFRPQRIVPKAMPEPEPVVPVVEADSDSDGVVDSKDQCPGTGSGITVDGRGCPFDSDNDGVADHADECPGTEPAASVDLKGCMLDNDGDGVGNHRDQCPATPVGRQVDENGCKYVLHRTEEMTLQINFASNSSDITQDQYSEIETVARFLQKYGEVSTVIEGHTDDRGAADYNQKLSQSRANAVRNVLIERYGIAANRISAKGFGESRPIASNASSAGRSSNRRVVAVMKAEITE